MARRYSSDSDSSPESRALRYHSGSLFKGLTDPLDISWNLFSRNVIDRATKDEVDRYDLTLRKKSNILLTAVINRVEARPKLFYEFLEVLKEDGDDILRELADKLKGTINTFIEEAQSSSPIEPHPLQTNHPSLQAFPSHRPSTSHPSLQAHPSPANHPTLRAPSHRPFASHPSLQTLSPPTHHPSLPVPRAPSHLPPTFHPSLPVPPSHPLRAPTHHPSLQAPSLWSPLHTYSRYLQAYFRGSSTPKGSKWSPPVNQPYVNLALIRREKVIKKELLEFVIHSLHGDVDQILRVKEPVAIENLFDPKPGEVLQCILMEGAPGVGKTTLAWQVCHRWGRGELFLQYALVLLVKLRDESVNNADCLADLLIYHDESYKKEIAQHLINNDGKDVLIILEGLDELPAHLLLQPSVFTQLLSGVLLPSATLLVTSRPSATVKIWDKWKYRVSRHIEVLGFTQANIVEFIQNSLDDNECQDFEMYLTINPHIRSLMYIPINCSIVIAVYKNCRYHSKLLPRMVTDLYTSLVCTILQCHLKSHHYCGDFQTLATLPYPVDKHFHELTEIAYNGITKQQYYTHSQQFEHLGLMNTFTEQNPSECSSALSYSFLHLTIQEYLAACYISRLGIFEQEQLLQRMCKEKHLRNTCRFQAGLTKFKGIDRAILRAVIEKDCIKLEEEEENGEEEEMEEYEGEGGGEEEEEEEEGEKVEEEEREIEVEEEDDDDDDNEWKPGEEQDEEEEEEEEDEEKMVEEEEWKSALELSTYALQLLYECEDISILDSQRTYWCTLTDYSSLLDFSTLGYCISHSNCRWSPELGSLGQYLQSPDGIRLLIQELKRSGSSDYIIDGITCHHNDPQCVQELLKALPHRTLQYIDELFLSSKTFQPLPQCLPSVIAKMKSLRRLLLWKTTAKSLVHTLNSLARAPPTPLELLSLRGSTFSLQTTQALCSVLHSQSRLLTGVWLLHCGLDDDQACCLATGLHCLTQLQDLNLAFNSIKDHGAAAIAEATLGLPNLILVILLDNPISTEGHKELDKYKHKSLVHQASRQTRRCYQLQ